MNSLSSSSSFSPFNLLSNEMEVEILNHVPDLSVLCVCRKWYHISLDPNRTFSLLNENKKQWEMESGIREGQKIEDPLKRVQFIQDKLIHRIAPLVGEKIEKALCHLPPSLPAFHKLLCVAKASNLLAAYQIIVNDYPQLRPKSGSITTKDTPLCQQAEDLRAWLKAHPDQCRDIKKIDLQGQNLTSIPEELNLFTQAVEVNLAFNCIRVIPAFFGREWKALENLYLNNNGIKELPDDFGTHWQDIKSLYLCYNSLKQLPANFGQRWKTLRTLHLRNNEITQLPEKFGSNWQGLLKIDVRSNQNPLSLDALRHQWPKLQICEN